MHYQDVAESYCPEVALMKVHSEQVNGSSSQPTGKSSETRAVERPGHSRTPGAVASNGDDRVVLSGFAGRIAEAQRADAGAQASRLQELTKAYQSGRYGVDHEQLGQTLLQSGVLYA